MWAIMAVTLHMLAGPDVWAVTNAGTFETKVACEAEIAASVPAMLEEKDKSMLDAGELAYVCLKVIQR